MIAWWRFDTTDLGRHQLVHRAQLLERVLSETPSPNLFFAKPLAVWGCVAIVDDRTVVGRPDIAFRVPCVAIFCDGDFWHGRDLERRLERLQAGHNAPHWVGKISGNVARDRKRDDELTNAGWLVQRFWETDIVREPDRIARVVLEKVTERRRLVPRQR